MHRGVAESFVTCLRNKAYANFTLHEAWCMFFFYPRGFAHAHGIGGFQSKDLGQSVFDRACNISLHLEKASALMHGTCDGRAANQPTKAYLLPYRV